MTPDLQRSTQSLSLVERLKLQRKMPVLLLDVSGSMSEYLDYEDKSSLKRKIDALRDIVNNLSPTPELYAFSSEATHVQNKNSIPDPHGSTALSNGLKLVKERKKSSIVLVTDGNVDFHDRIQSLQEVKDIELKIIYVGNSPIPDFLIELSKSARSGSFCKSEDLKETKLLTEKIQLLLTGPM
jgi:hypothetical protein